MRAEHWPWTWVGRVPPLAADAGAAALLLLAGVGGILEAPPPGQPELALTLLLVVLQSVPLLARRRWPVAVLVVMLVAFAAVNGLRLPGRSSGIGILLAIYSVGLYGEQVRRVAVGVVGVAGLVVAFAAYLVVSTPLFLIVPGFALCAAWLLGDYARTRRAHLADLGERAARAERDRDEDRLRAADEERARIARELHDVVAHHVSVIAVQAGAARIVHDTDPAAAVRTLATIETTARQALAELSRLLGVIRREEGAGASPRAPQPGLDHLDALVERARNAGLDVELVVRGRHRALPAALDLSAYRIVQEAITNAMRHAPRAHVQVALRYGGRDLELRVTDDGSGSGQPAAGEPATGHGLIGIRERVALFGGELEAGPRASGGFQVAARLPLGDAEA
jgi:signal transduction histidine kinase